MKKVLILLILIFFIPSALFSQNIQNTKNISFSLDPLSLIGAIYFLSTDEEEKTENSFSWFGMDFNWETERGYEAGAGFFIGDHRTAISTKLRFFSNRENQSGVFFGFYGLIEWRKMDWFFDDDNELTISWFFPSTEKSNEYHSIGITGGFDIGFRIRLNNTGITPYIGLGIPLFYCFGSLPPDSYKRDFYLGNAIIRAINIGIKFDFFWD